MKRRNTTGSYLHDLTYTYGSGNQLTAISDAGSATITGTFTYDGNGNQLTDSKKGIGIVYNQLNLPSPVSKTGSSNLD